MGIGEASVVEFSGVWVLTGGLILKLRNGHRGSIHLTPGSITTEVTAKIVTHATGSCNLPVAVYTIQPTIVGNTHRVERVPA